MPGFVTAMDLALREGVVPTETLALRETLAAEAILAPELILPGALAASVLATACTSARVGALVAATAPVLSTSFLIICFFSLINALRRRDGAPVNCDQSPKTNGWGLV